MKIPEGYINGNDFLETIKVFDKIESFRGRWYWLILKKLKAYDNSRRDLSYEMGDDEAILYIAFLSQWNRVNRQIVELNYNEFKNYMTIHNEDFSLLENKNLETIELESEKNGIINLFHELQYIKGIEWVGASKILHMRLPKLFVPIDTDIAKDDAYKIKKTALGYFDFLNKIKEKFGKEPLSIWKSKPEEVKGHYDDKTFAKAIDEYNYCKVHPKDFERQ